MSTDAARQGLVVVDARSPSEYPLREILDRARARHEVRLVASADRVLEVVTATRPAAILVHAGLARDLGTPAAGPIIASLCRRVVPAVGTLLYAGSLGTGYETALAQNAIHAPVVYDQRLVAFFDPLIAKLGEYAAAMAACYSMSRPVPRDTDARLPVGFRVETFLDEADLAMTRACIREHPDRTQAAAALKIPLETFERYRDQCSLAIPRRRRPDSLGDQRLLWCSERPAPPCIVDQCEAMHVDVREVPAGSLEPRSIRALSTAGAVVEPLNARGAADLWTLSRSVRPFLVVAAPAPHVRLLLEELGVALRLAHLDGPVLAALLRAGKAGADLYADEDFDLRLAVSPMGGPAWPIDRPALRRSLDARVLLHAKETEESNEAAAEAVNLEPKTFTRRLRAARQLLSGVRTSGHG